ncbi:MAG: RlmI/RlmK family 23S rRNA methyltransferase, partial [Bacillota bacterium]|nr:RlmI/RlmK family 23S rRNA methyltransferase [Bacillota bacterium]
MRKEAVLKVKRKYTSQLKSGYPLISKEALVSPNELEHEGTIVNLVDEKNNFIAKGYYGKQNKGYGWLLSRNEHETFDHAFFEKKIKAAINNRELYYASKETTSFRVFNGEGDGIGGLTIDYYDGYYLLTWYSQGIYHYRDAILLSLEKLVKYKGIY